MALEAPLIVGWCVLTRYQYTTSTTDQYCDFHQGPRYYHRECGACIPPSTVGRRPCAPVSTQPGGGSAKTSVDCMIRYLCYTTNTIPSITIVVYFRSSISPTHAGTLVTASVLLSYARRHAVGSSSMRRCMSPAHDNIATTRGELGQARCVSSFLGRIADIVRPKGSVEERPEVL